MKKEYRLTRATDFKRVRLQGKSYAHSLMVLIACQNPNGELHIGVAAGRSVGKAVDRNRAKRRLRAAIRKSLQLIIPGWDLIFIVRTPILAADFIEIQVGLQLVLEHAGILLKKSSEIDDWE